MIKRNCVLPCSLSRYFHLLEWPILVLMTVYAFFLKDPYLLRLRPVATVLLVTASVFLMIMYVKKRKGLVRATALCLLGTTLTVTLYSEILFRYHRNYVLNDTNPVIEDIGQHFVVGYRNFPELKHLAAEGLIGGVFITHANAAGKSAEQLRAEIAELQILRVLANLPPLLVSADQEGGMVSRLSPPLQMRPTLEALIKGAENPAEKIRLAEEFGRAQGNEMASLGVNVNLSPVVDLKSGEPRSLVDLHTQIDKRAISSDPKETVRIALAYTRGLESQGVRATLKHFPGLGRVREDTHHFTARLTQTVAELEKTDWQPFRKVARAGHSLIMLGHVMVSEIDDENPVSFSKEVIRQVIRERWQHDGVLITDDLTMRSAYRHGLCNVTVKALNAGVDHLLVSYDHEKFYDMLYCAKKAYENGQLDMTMLKKSHDRRRVLLARH